MKKILAVLIAISMVATMAFAADFTFSVENTGDLLNWSTDASNAATLFANDGNNGCTTLSASVDGLAGTSMKITNVDADGNGQKELTVSNATIWLIPVEGVKLTLGGADYNAWADVDFDGSDDDADAYGATVKGEAFNVEYTGVKNLTVNVAVSTWTTTDKPVAAAKVAYAAAEAANIAVTADTDLTIGAAVTGKVAPVEYAVAVEYKDNVKVGGKVAAEFAPVNVWGAAQFDLADSSFIALEGLTVDLAPVTIAQGFGYNVDKKDVMNANVKATVEVAPATCWVEVSTGDVTKIAENVALTAGAKVAFSGNVGEAEWSVTPEVDVDILQDFKVGVKVPYSVKIAF